MTYHQLQQRRGLLGLLYQKGVSKRLLKNRRACLTNRGFSVTTVFLQLQRQWLMQHSEVGQSMGWVDQWQGTNCEEKKLNVIICFTSCITIKLERNSTSGWFEDGKSSLVSPGTGVVAGYMRDCADDLIHMSPDLPKEHDYLNFKNNATFINIRYGYKITYKFSMVGLKSKIARFIS